MWYIPWDKKALGNLRYQAVFFENKNFLILPLFNYLLALLFFKHILLNIPSIKYREISNIRTEVSGDIPTELKNPCTLTYNT